MTREELTQTIRAKKRAKRLTWNAISAAAGNGSPVFTTAAVLSQMRLSEDVELTESDGREIGVHPRSTRAKAAASAGRAKAAGARMANASASKSTGATGKKKTASAGARRTH
ncbi:MAG: hypothetical protein ACLPYS_04940 [Vulcanimicrobiaceae bacterium]|jgi:hypothetical protein